MRTWTCTQCGMTNPCHGAVQFTQYGGTLCSICAHTPMWSWEREGAVL